MELAFMVIDDSELDCFIAKKVVGKSGSSTNIITYNEANAALNQIRSTIPKTSNLLTVILLDLSLPVMSGFEFIEEFEKLPHVIQDRYVIYILSSSRNKSDRIRALSYHKVSEMIEKPLTKGALCTLLLDLKSQRL